MPASCRRLFLACATAMPLAVAPSLSFSQAQPADGPAVVAVGMPSRSLSPASPTVFSGRVISPDGLPGASPRLGMQQMGWRLQQLEGELSVLARLAEQQQRELRTLARQVPVGLPWPERLLAAAAWTLAGAAAAWGAIRTVRRRARRTVAMPPCS